MRRQLSLVSAGVLLTAAAFAVSPALTAGAVTQPVPKATGSVAIANHAYQSFSVFDYGNTGDRGSVDYTDFGWTTGTAGSGVWTFVVGQESEIVFTGGDHHWMKVDTVTPLSTHSMAFTAHGVTLTPAAYTWTMKGKISGATVTFDMVYDQPVLGQLYTVHSGDGAIVAGNISGTALDSMGYTLPWTITAGAVEALHFATNTVSPVVVDSVAGTATFGYTIPAGGAPFAGLAITIAVTDGGSPAYVSPTVQNDTWSQNGILYMLTSGNLVVH